LGCVCLCFGFATVWWKGIAHCGWAERQGGKIPRAGKSASGILGKARKGFYSGEAGITDFGSGWWIV